MPYQRAMAVEYAKQHWNTACDDGLIYLYTGVLRVEQEKKKAKLPDPETWVVMFMPDPPESNSTEGAFFLRPATGGGGVMVKHLAGGPYELVKFHEDKGLADCAHYVSRCVGAGGLKGVNHTGVTGLVSTLRGRSDTKTLLKVGTRAAGQLVVDSGVFREGDIVAYAHQSGHGTSYTHSTMYVGNNRITCHTLARFGPHYNNDMWNLTTATDWRFTLIHFTADDPAPGGATVSGLSGWWEVEVKSMETRYYYFDPGGVARMTLKAPKDTGKELSRWAAKTSGYWFERGGKVFIFWFDLGSVETWSLGGSFPAKVSGDLDGLLSTSGNKL